MTAKCVSISNSGRITFEVGLYCKCYYIASFRMEQQCITNDYTQPRRHRRIPTKPEIRCFIFTAPLQDYASLKILKNRAEPRQVVQQGRLLV